MQAPFKETSLPIKDGAGLIACCKRQSQRSTSSIEILGCAWTQEEH